MDPLYRQEIPAPFRGAEKVCVKNEHEDKKTDIDEIKTAAAPESCRDELKSQEEAAAEPRAYSGGGIDRGRLLALFLLLYGDGDFF